MKTLRNIWKTESIRSITTVAFVPTPIHMHMRPLGLLVCLCLDAKIPDTILLVRLLVNTFLERVSPLVPFVLVVHNHTEVVV